MTEHHNGGIIDQLLSEADRLYQMGRAQQAADILVATIEQFPDDPRACHAFSLMLIDGSQFEDSLALLEKLPQDVHSQQRARELAGRSLMGLGRLDEAGELAEAILADNPDSAPGLNLMGELAHLRGDSAAAEAYYGQAVKIAPDNGPARVNLGLILWERGEHKAALDLIEKGFSCNPGDPAAATAYHAAVTELGEFERSEPAFLAAVAQFSHNERLQNLLIDVLLQQQKYPAAHAEIQRALAVFGAADGMLAAAGKVKVLAGQGGSPTADKASCCLSVCMIVKNEAIHLAKCLQSVKAVADEIIVVDTGSTDGSKDIAGIFGASIFDFQWGDDFAEAKNFAISKACGEWILSLDADEVISPMDHVALRKLVSQTNDRPIAYSIVTRNYMNRFNAVGWSPNDGKYPGEEAGSGWFPSEKVRLFPNHDGIRFVYPVHEMVEPALERLGIHIQACQIPVHHYGKLDEGNSAAKGRRYYRIGMKKLAEMAQNVDAIRELAIQAANLEEYEDAVSLWEKVLGLQPDMADAYVNMGTAYWNLAKYQEAVAAAHKAMALAPDLKEAHFNYCLGLLHLGQAQAAIPVLESLVANFPEYLSAQFLLAAARCCAGQSENGARGLTHLKHSPMGSGLPISCHTLAQGLRSAGQVAYATAILDGARQTDNASEDVLALLRSCQAAQ